MSDGHWETVRGSHHNAERITDPEQAPAPPGTRPSRAGHRVKQSADVIVGWRVWGLSSVGSMSSRSSLTDPLILVSVYMNSVWRPGEAMKACCGADSVRHGIHAFTTSAEAAEYMTEARKPIRYVLGEVSLWGRVIIHERGYRAEAAYPRHIFVPNRYRGGRDYVGELRRSYGVEADWTS
jgi:hypothetical protein